MPDFAVTVTTELDRPITDDQSDAVMDLLPGDAAMACRDVPAELSVTVSATAEDPVAAGSLVDLLVRTVAGQSGVLVGRTVELEVMDWDRYDAQLVCEEPSNPVV